MRLLCDATPKCYGASSALLSILDHVDAETRAMATSVTWEILASDPAVQRCMRIDVKDRAAVEDCLKREEVDAVLAVSNLTNVETYARHDLPFFFVDILYWYSENKTHPVWETARASFVQSFPGVRERLAQGAAGPRVVGPLIRRLPPAPARLQGTFVNIGGARSPWVVPGVNSAYPEFVIDLIASVRDVLPPGPLRVAAGSDAVRSVDPSRVPPETRLATMPQREFLAELAGSSLYLTAPGLNAVFEGLVSGKPMVLLPPQNATQVLQLARYEAAGIVESGLNLPDLLPGFPRVDRVRDEERFTATVLEGLREVIHSRSLRRRIENHVREQVLTCAERADARARFAADLGEPGGAAVAREITRWWRGRQGDA